MKTITVRLPDKLVDELPIEDSSISEIIKLGLKELKIKKALDKYKKGGMSLAKAAELAGISIREIIPAAYSYGLEPIYDRVLDKTRITPEIAAKL